MRKNPLLLLILPILILVGAVFLNTQAQKSSYYEGLSTVPCIDPTQKIVKKFTFNIDIQIDGKNYPVDSNLGHDFGNCLHEIYANDASGKITVLENSKDNLSLGDFFNVWHKSFSKNQIFGYFTDSNHTLEVYVDGKLITKNPRSIPLLPNEQIRIVYK